MAPLKNRIPTGFPVGMFFISDLLTLIIRAFCSLFSCRLFFTASESQFLCGFRMQKVMSVLTFLSYEYKLVFLAVFVQRPRPNYEKPVQMQDTPT